MRKNARQRKKNKQQTAPSAGAAPCTHCASPVAFTPESFAKALLDEHEKREFEKWNSKPYQKKLKFWGTILNALYAGIITFFATLGYAFWTLLTFLDQNYNISEKLPGWVMLVARITFIVVPGGIALFFFKYNFLLDNEKSIEQLSTHCSFLTSLLALCIAAVSLLISISTIQLSTGQ